MLSKGSKGLGSVELGALSNFGHAPFARGLVLFSIHLDPLLWVAAGTVRGIELAVAAIQDVHFRVGQLGVAMSVDLAILFAEKASPGWISVRTVMIGRTTYMRGARCAENSQCRIRRVLDVSIDASVPKSRSDSFSFSQ